MSEQDLPACSGRKNRPGAQTIMADGPFETTLPSVADMQACQTGPCTGMLAPIQGQSCHTNFLPHIGTDMEVHIAFAVVRHNLPWLHDNLLLHVLKVSVSATTCSQQCVFSCHVSSLSFRFACCIPVAQHIYLRGQKVRRLSINYCSSIIQAGHPSMVW